MSNNIINELSDNDIETIVKIAEESVPEGALDMRDVKDSVKVDTDAELVIGETIENSNGMVVGVTSADKQIDGMDEIDRIAATFENATAANVNLFDIENGTDTNGLINEAATKKTADIAKGTFDLDDNEVFQMMDTLTKMHNDPKYPVYANLPEKVQLVISKLAYENKVPINKLDMISRSMMEELLKESGIDNTLIDLEKAIDEALQIPSIMDLYTEHTRNVMENIIPQTIDKIKDEFPDKAEKLAQVKNAFQNSYNFSLAKAAYLTNARIRKTVRRWETEFNRTLDKFNFLNERSNFKMNDIRYLPEVLTKVLIEDPDISYGMHTNSGEEVPESDMKLLEMNITQKDIHKFCILLCKHCENLDPNDVVDAAYMYYMVRNIIALRHAQEAKTDFAVELINNICDAITFIRDKESEFNESNMDKSKSTKKSN